MSMAIEKYLDRVMTFANLDEPHATEVRQELRDHLKEKAERLEAEAGLPPEDAVFKAVEDHGNPRVVGYALRPAFPWLDVRTRGTARGVVAIGPRAVGIVAFGGAACGVFAFGGVAAGVVTWGGMVLALLFAWGGLGASLGMAFVGVGVGTLAIGGMVAGIVAVGGTAAGLWVPAAGGGVSYFTAENVPPALSVADPWLENPTASSVWLSLLLLVPFLVVVPVSTILQERERRRVNRADPTLAE